MYAQLSFILPFYPASGKPHCTGGKQRIGRLSVSQGEDATDLDRGREIEERSSARAQKLGSDAAAEQYHGLVIGLRKILRKADSLVVEDREDLT